MAKERIEQKGLENKINLVLKDYRDLEGTYDKVVSIEMVEAVGHEYLEEYFEVCSKLTKEDGLFLSMDELFNSKGTYAFVFPKA